jgi:hypothetical protein
LTGVNGCTEFILPTPGNYTITEASRDGWTPIGPTHFDFTAEYSGSYGPFTFVNGKPGSITVVKDAGGNSTTSFDLLQVAV